MTIPRVPKGRERAWVRCRKCGNVAYYDYVPYSLSNPIMVAPCGHGLAERFHDAHASITADEAIIAISKEKARCRPSR